jgi:hypothetical protein
MKPAKRRRKQRSKKRGLRALLSKFMKLQSKFMQPPQTSKPPAPKQDSQRTAPLTPRFRNKSGPKL